MTSCGSKMTMGERPVGDRRRGESATWRNHSSHLSHSPITLHVEDRWRSSVNMISEALSAKNWTEAIAEQVGVPMPPFARAGHVMHQSWATVAEFALRCSRRDQRPARRWVDVINLGLCAVSAVFFPFTLPVQGGIMITGSCQCRWNNGFKFRLAQGSHSLWRGHSAPRRVKESGDFRPARDGCPLTPLFRPPAASEAQFCRRAGGSPPCRD